MGYTTDFTGEIKLSRKLTIKEAKELLEIAEDSDIAQEKTGIHGYMQWVPTHALDGIVWDGNEKFYNYTQFMEWLCGWLKDRDIAANGELFWSGEDAADTGRIVVQENAVTEIKNHKPKTHCGKPLTLDALQEMALEQLVGEP